MVVCRRSQHGDAGGDRIYYLLLNYYFILIVYTTKIVYDTVHPPTPPPAFEYAHHPLGQKSLFFFSLYLLRSPVRRETLRDDNNDDDDDGARTDGRRAYTRARTHQIHTHTDTHARAKRHTDTTTDENNARSTWRPTFTLRERGLIRPVCVSLALTRLGGTAAGRGLGGRLRRRVHCHGKPPLHWNAGRAVTAKEQQALRTNTRRCNTSARANVCVDLVYYIYINIYIYFTSMYYSV